MERSIWSTIRKLLWISWWSIFLALIFQQEGFLQGKEEIKKAYETGKGKVILRSKTKIEDIKGGKQQIVINEIPYEVNKSQFSQKNGWDPFE